MIVYNLIDHMANSMIQDVAPYNGYGSLEDSMQSCQTLVPQPPKKDFIKMIENDGTVLRFEAILVSSTALPVLFWAAVFV